MNSPAAVLMSIKPVYVAAIMAGSKTVELRRRLPRDSKGLTLFIYSSSPERAVVAEAVIASTRLAPVDVIWRDEGERVGISRSSFDAYFRGISHAGAIGLTDVRPLAAPVHLPVLRERLGLIPPQSYRFLCDQQVYALRRAAGLATLQSTVAAASAFLGAGELDETCQALLADVVGAGQEALEFAGLPT